MVHPNLVALAWLSLAWSGSITVSIDLFLCISWSCVRDNKILSHNVKSSPLRWPFVVIFLRDPPIMKRRDSCYFTRILDETSDCSKFIFPTALLGNITLFFILFLLHPTLSHYQFWATGELRSFHVVWPFATRGAGSFNFISLNFHHQGDLMLLV